MNMSMHTKICKQINEVVTKDFTVLYCIYNSWNSWKRATAL